MICNICGQQLPDDSKFCSECGANLFEVNDNQNSSQNTDSQTPNPDLNPDQAQNQDTKQKQSYQIPHPNQNYDQNVNRYSNQNQGYQIPHPNQYQTQNQNQGCQNPYPNQGQLNNNPNNTFALAGFILGIISIVFGIITFGIAGICAVVFSSIALSKSKTLCSRDMVFSVIGLVLGIISIVATVFLCIFIFCA